MQFLRDTSKQQDRARLVRGLWVNVLVVRASGAPRTPGASCHTAARGLAHAFARTSNVCACASSPARARQAHSRPRPQSPHGPRPATDCLPQRRRRGAAMLGGNAGWRHGLVGGKLGALALWAKTPTHRSCSDTAPARSRTGAVDRGPMRSAHTAPNTRLAWCRLWVSPSQTGTHARHHVKVVCCRRAPRGTGLSPGSAGVSPAATILAPVY